MKHSPEESPIYQQRTKLGLSRAELALRCGISPSWIYRLESMPDLVRTLPVQRLLDLAQGLETTPQVLVPQLKESP